MKKVFITGISGTGKTTIAHALNIKCIHSISIDEVPGLCVWKNKVSGKKVDYEVELNKDFIETHDWICDVEILQKLLDAEKETVVVLGIAANQNEFLGLFDKILLLQCKPETFIERIMQRKDNDFGKDKSAQDIILSWYQEFERDLLKKGAITINVEGSIDEVIETIINEILV
jgi:dephospho-CoA kinase